MLLTVSDEELQVASTSNDIGTRVRDWLQDLKVRIAEDKIVTTKNVWQIEAISQTANAVTFGSIGPKTSRNIARRGAVILAYFNKKGTNPTGDELLLTLQGFSSG